MLKLKSNRRAKRLRPNKKNQKEGLKTKLEKLKKPEKKLTEMQGKLLTLSTRLVMIKLTVLRKLPTRLMILQKTPNQDQKIQLARLSMPELK